MKNLYIASDHGGYQLKKRLIRFVENDLKLDITDLGPKEYNKLDDYPDYVIPLAKKVAKSKTDQGIVICRNGIGVCIAVNKVKGVRAGIGYNIDAAKTMRADDDTNVLCLAADHVSDEHAMAILKKWLETPADLDARHVRRRNKVKELEE